MKNIFIILISIFFFSCEEKEKTYEEMEAAILCDVLPEIVKYELKENLSRAKAFPLVPPPDLDSLKYSKIQLDSILKEFKISKNQYVISFEEKSDSLKSVLNQYKKYTLTVVDTLLFYEKLKNDSNQYFFNFLESRSLDASEFSSCNLDIKLVTYNQTFEGEDRRTGLPVLFLTRILISKDKQHCFFSILKMQYTYLVYCTFSNELNKWQIDKIVKDTIITP